MKVLIFQFCIYNYVQPIHTYMYSCIVVIFKLRIKKDRFVNFKKFEWPPIISATVHVINIAFAPLWVSAFQFLVWICAKITCVKQKCHIFKYCFKIFVGKMFYLCSSFKILTSVPAHKRIAYRERWSYVTRLAVYIIYYIL